MVLSIKRSSLKSFRAVINLGLEKGYEGEPIPKKAVYDFVSNYQNKLIENEGVYLSVSISESDIVLSGQTEKHMQLKIINYPRFPLSEVELKKLIEDFVIQLMKEFDQNRIVIEYLDETVMLDFSDEIDGRIKSKNQIL